MPELPLPFPTKFSPTSCMHQRRDMLAARAAALEERLEEGRAERGQLTNLRQLAAEAEAARARVEEEVLATARIATGLEARLASARAEADAAQREALAANDRCQQVSPILSAHSSSQRLTARSLLQVMLAHP